MQPKALWVAGLGVLALVLSLSLTVGCSSSKKETSISTPTHTAAASRTVTGETETMTTLQVVLKEWSITGDTGAAIPSVKAGEVNFDVRNDGNVPHELVVIKTDTDPANLPRKDGDADESGSVGEVDNVVAGETKAGTLNLQPGTYAIICNLPGHYKQGMHTQLTVE